MLCAGDVVEAPVRLRLAHRVGEAAAAGHDGDAAAAELGQHLQPVAAGARRASGCRRA